MNPFISQGSGTKDDVRILAKKGEYIVNNRAVGMMGLGFMDRLNSGEMSEEYMGRRGVMAFEKGGLVESAPADRDRGLFSVGT
jgi:hypothetical protein